MLISICGFWGIALPSIYFLAFKLGFDGVGIWWGITIGLFVTGTISLLRFNWLSRSANLAALVTRKNI
jgi:MATE family multidrug resistance protein